MSGYRSNKGINWSTLKYMKESPADYKLRRDFPSEETDAMRLGTLIHAMLLEPDTLGDRYAVIPAMDMRKKESKEIYAEIVEGNPGKILVPAEPKNKTDRFSWKLASRVAESAKSKQIVRKMLASLQIVEWEVYAVCKHTGLPLKGLIDAVTPKSVIDVKTITSVGKIFYNIRAFDYIGQLAYYRYLLDCAGEDPRELNRFVFLETTAPYKTRIMNVDPRVLEQAESDNLRLLERVAECMEHDEWPDDSDHILEYEYKGAA
jgi:exodeoxyribonuclease VIII